MTVAQFDEILEKGALLLTPFFYFSQCKTTTLRLREFFVSFQIYSDN
jgi:hypothetical protein